MPFIHIPKIWQLPDSVTPEAAFFDRRRFLKIAVGASIAGALPLVGCQQNTGADADSPIANTKALKVNQNPGFAQADRAITNELQAATHNNFYEFGGTKNIWRNAQAMSTDPWK